MTMYEMFKYWLLQTLENYHKLPLTSKEKRRIDTLIELSRTAALSDTDKKYHNLIVLKYITTTKISIQKICEVLHISRDKANFENVTNNAIDRLLILAFGFYGVDWQSQANTDSRK